MKMIKPSHSMMTKETDCKQTPQPVDSLAQNFIMRKDMIRKEMFMGTIFLFFLAMATFFFFSTVQHFGPIMSTKTLKTI